MKSSNFHFAWSPALQCSWLSIMLFRIACRGLQKSIPAQMYGEVYILICRILSHWRSLDNNRVRHIGIYIIYVCVYAKSLLLFCRTKRDVQIFTAGRQHQLVYTRYWRLPMYNIMCLRKCNIVFSHERYEVTTAARGGVPRSSTVCFRWGIFLYDNNGSCSGDGTYTLPGRLSQLVPGYRWSGELQAYDAYYIRVQSKRRRRTCDKTKKQKGTKNTLSRTILCIYSSVYCVCVCVCLCRLRFRKRVNKPSSASPS